MCYVHKYPLHSMAKKQIVTYSVYFMQFDVEVIYLDLVYLELLGNLTHSRHPVGYVCHMCGPNTLVT